MIRRNQRVSAWQCASLLLAALLGVGCGPPTSETPLPPATLAVSTPAARPAPAPHDIQLKDVSDGTGIAFRHTDGGSGQKYVFEPMSAGLALLDFDGDGLIDVYFANGAPLPPLPPDPMVTGALYRNEGNFRFRDVTAMAGVGGSHFTLGVVAGDYDNDGDCDLYLNNFGPNVLYRNNGDGTFADAASAAGVEVGEHVGAGAAFLDADRDGDLDLFVGAYVDARLDNNVRHTVDGFPSFPGPQDFEPHDNYFFLNDGDGTFTDASAAAGISGVPGSGMGVICADYDGDGDTDIFVANDERPNSLFENDGAGKFEEVALFRGFAYGLDGRPRGNMGLDCADYDNDGRLDVFATTYSNEACVLYRNRGGRFEDVTVASGASAGSLPHAKWGNGFADFDNDGDRDLFLACGHLDQEVHRWKPNTAFRVANILLENTGDGRLADISARCGDGLAVVQSSRGTGLDDLDNDGDVDLVVLNSSDKPTVIQNDTRARNNWLQIELRGTRSNRDGVGAQVRVTAGGRTQLDEVHSGRGYQSHHGMRLHFGLGSADRVERIEVRWIGGDTDVVEAVAVNQLLRIRESTQLENAGR